MQIKKKIDWKGVGKNKYTKQRADIKKETGRYMDRQTDRQTQTDIWGQTKTDLWRKLRVKQETIENSLLFN